MHPCGTPYFISFTAVTQLYSLSVGINTGFKLLIIMYTV